MPCTGIFMKTRCLPEETVKISAKDNNKLTRK
jgi:hypothetical protein